MSPLAHGRPTVGIVTDDQDLRRRVALALLRAGLRVSREADTPYVFVDAAARGAARRIETLRAEDATRVCVAIVGRDAPACEVAALLRAGARACIHGDETPDRLRRLTDGDTDDGVWLSPSVAAVLTEAFAHASDAEIPARDVLAMLEQRSFESYLQPIADLRDGSVVAVEALARFRGVTGYAPHQWLRAADAAGVRNELEIALADEALRLLRQLPERVLLTVNVSPKAALDPRLSALLDHHPVRRVVLELTDGLAGAEYEHLAEALSPQLSRGLRVAIDASAIGFDGLQRLGILRPAFIKLGRTLTRGIERDLPSQKLLSTLLDVATAHGAALVATGVETERELAAVRELGITLGQGYLLAAPAPLSGTRTAPFDLPQPDETVEGDQPLEAVDDEEPVSLKDFSRSIARVLGARFPGCSVLITHLDHATRRLGIFAAHGVLIAQLPPGTTRPLDTAPEFLMSSGAGPRLCADVGSHPAYAPLVAERTGLRSFAAVPIELSDGSRVGAVSVMHGEADAFRPRDLEVLDAAATRLTRAVEAETATMSEATRAHHLRRIVHHDDLTDTLNVHGFYEAVEQATERESRLSRPAWLICARLEGVERLTTELGRAMEGLVLRDLVAALRSCGEPTDELGRIGEHEIAVLLTPGHDERRTAKFCADVEERFAALAERRGVAPVLEVSMVALDALDGVLTA